MKGHRLAATVLFCSLRAKAKQPPKRPRMQLEEATLSGNPITIGGITLPSDAPLLLTFVAVHVAAGLVGVVAGATAMVSEKQYGRHPRAGQCLSAQSGGAWQTLQT